MTSGAGSPKYSLDIVLPKLSSVLRALFEEGQKRKPGAIAYQRLMQEMPGDTDVQEAMLVGALAILHGMGLIQIDARGSVSGISRYAYYMLGSLSKFLSASVPAADKPVGEREQDYLVSLTKALESARVENAQVDDEPLHFRRIVNVLVKSRQVRHWTVQDVYLHVYHPQWKQYHLVGLSHKDDSKTDEEIAQLALRRQVGLMPDQYTLDPVFNPPEITIKDISATSGALTKYTLRLMAVKEIRVKLELQKLLQKLIEEEGVSRDWFRWFTWEEIKNRESKQGEPIMFSTPLVIEQVALSSVPISAPHADDARRPAGILNELSCRFTREQILALAGALLILALLQFLSRAGILLNRSNPMLDNLANIAQVATAILALGSAAGAFIAFLRKS